MSYITRLQSIIQNKLAARTTGTSVGAGGVATSVYASFSTASASYVNATGFQITIVTTGRPLFLGLIGTPGGTPLAILDANNNGFLQFYDGTTGYGEQRVGSTSSGSLSLPPSSFWTIISKAASTYTFNVQIKTSSGGSFLLQGSLISYEL